MEALRTWFEVPSIAHFCSLFRAAFDLPDFDIEDLETGLQAFSEELESPFIIELICKLLRGCYSRTDIESFNYEVYLKDIFKYRAALDGGEKNLILDSDFKSLDLREKVLVIHRLCDYRLDAEDVMEQLKGLDGDNMRIAPLGVDDDGGTYWYFYGNRLYKEDPEPVAVEEIPKKKKREKDKVDKVENKASTSRGKNTKRGRGKQKKEDETPARRSARGRVLTKKKTYASSESSEVDEESSEEEQFTPVKRTKSQESTPSGRQTRSARKTKQNTDNIEETPKGTGTRKSRRGSTVTPVTKKRGRPRKTKVNGDLSDDSDEEWNTPLSQSVGKTPSSSRGRGKKARQSSEEKSDEEKEEMEVPARKRGRPRNAVKITPDSSVNGDAQDQDMEDVMENNDSGIEDEPMDSRQPDSVSHEPMDSRQPDSVSHEPMDSRQPDSVSHEPVDSRQPDSVSHSLENSRASSVETDIQSVPGQINGKEEEISCTANGVENYRHDDINTDDHPESISHQSEEKDGVVSHAEVKMENHVNEDNEQAMKDRSNETSEVMTGIECGESVKVEKKELECGGSPDVEKKELQCGRSPEVEKKELECGRSPEVEKKELECEASTEVEKKELEYEVSTEVEKKEQECTNDSKQNGVAVREEPEEETETSEGDNYNHSTSKPADSEIKIDVLGDLEVNSSDDVNKVTLVTIGTEIKPPPKPLYQNPRWHLVCETLDDWTGLAERLKESTTKPGKELYKCITNDFLPEMPAILEARERDKKKRQQQLSIEPRRVSARITTKMKEFQEQERILEEARQLEEQRRKEEEEERERMREIERQEEERRLREERQKAREERQKRLELRELKAQLLAEGKELPPELVYTGNTQNSKYIDDERAELDQETLDDMEKMLEEVKSHKDSWPFLDPVEEDIAPGYHDIVKKPMDLSTIEKKLTSGNYRTTKRFISDLNLMINNCFQFSGADSELGRMATRLRRYINKCIKIFLDKTDEDDEDEDYHTPISTQTEKRYRPRRAATSRAMDTIRGAFDDDKFDEEMTSSTPGHEYASQSKRKRLIPELSGDITNNPPRIIVNGERPVNKPDTNNPNSATKIWAESTDTTKETKVLTVNGKTFVYKFNTTPKSSAKKIVEKPSFVISNSPEKHVSSAVPTVVNSTTTAPRILVRPSSTTSGGAILPVSSAHGNKVATGIAKINTPDGPKIIQIMSPQSLGQTATTQIRPQAATPQSPPAKAIRISDGMLLLDGKATGIQISGKTKIIYRGAVPGGQSATPGQSTVVVSGQGQNRVGNPIVISGQGQPRAASPYILQKNASGQIIATLPVASHGMVSSTGQVLNVATVANQGIIAQSALVNQPVIQSVARQVIAAVPAAVHSSGQLVTNAMIPHSSVPGQPTTIVQGPSSPAKTILIPKVGPCTVNSTGIINQGLTGISQQPQLISNNLGQGVAIQMIPASPVVQSVNAGQLNVDVSLVQNSLTSSSVKPSPVVPSNSDDINLGLISSVSVDNPVSVLTSNAPLSDMTSESLMGPPLLVPPKRKSSGSPDSKSILPPKVVSPSSECKVNNDNTSKSETKLTFMGMGSTVVTNVLQSPKCVNTDKNLGDSDKYPPFKVSHSMSPSKGNLFENIKTDLSESLTSSVDTDVNKLSTDSSESVLSKGLLDKVSTFKASLQSKNLAEKISIPAHLLQKSIHKDNMSPVMVESLHDQGVVCNEAVDPTGIQQTDS